MKLMDRLLYWRRRQPKDELTATFCKARAEDARLKARVESLEREAEFISRGESRSQTTT